jgi:nucleotide-binding universal stress UspA family protein
LKSSWAWWRVIFPGGLATTAKSEAVLPAYLVGLVVAGVFLRDKTLVHRMRSIAFAMFTPFYFIKAGLYVSLPHYPETVDEIAEESEAADQYFSRLKKDLEATAHREGFEIPCERRAGHPAKTILTYAEEGGFDLIVLGSRGHSELWGRIMGHTAGRVSEHAHCDVLVVKPREPVRGDLPDAYTLTDDLADAP